MENSDQPAYPIFLQDCNVYLGLTKREQIAAMAMQGLLANNECDNFVLPNGKHTNSFENKAIFCAIIADQLLKQLEKDGKP